LCFAKFAASVVVMIQIASRTFIRGIRCILNNYKKLLKKIYFITKPDLFIDFIFFGPGIK